MTPRSKIDTWLSDLGDCNVYRISEQALPMINQMGVLPFFIAEKCLIKADLFTTTQQHTFESRYKLSKMPVTILEDAYDELLYGPVLKPFTWTICDAATLYGNPEWERKNLIVIESPLDVVQQAFITLEDRVLPGFSTIALYWEIDPMDIFLLNEARVPCISYDSWEPRYIGTDSSIQQLFQVVQNHPDQLSIGGEMRVATFSDFVRAFKGNPEHSSFYTLKTMKDYLSNE